MHPMLNIALSAARKAGKTIVRALDRLDTIKIAEKKAKDFVSEIDKQAEQDIIDIIRKTYPNHKIVAEESGETRGDDDCVWIIDPLDGTTNFIHGFPHFCISIAFQFRDQLQHGLIYDPVREELFTASRGEGARCNDKRIRVSQVSKFENAFISTGLPFRAPDNFPAVKNILSNLFGQVTNMRIAGSAALDLAYVAAGRLDGFYEMSLREWDMAAGALIIKEAGGIVRDMAGGEDYLKQGSIVCANPKIFKVLLDTIQSSLEENQTC